MIGHTMSEKALNQGDVRAVYRPGSCQKNDIGPGIVSRQVNAIINQGIDRRNEQRHVLLCA